MDDDSGESMTNLEFVKSAFWKLGYIVIAVLLNALKLGSSASRRRLWFIAIYVELPSPLFPKTLNLLSAAEG